VVLVERHGLGQPAYDKLYQQQSLTVNPAKRRAIIYKMQKMVYDEFVYTTAHEPRGAGRDRRRSGPASRTR
jgi:ABC-type transport system substrate-binding protein